MDIEEKYVVYEFGKIMDGTKHLSLIKVSFKGMVINSFDTEKDAIQTLIDDKLIYTDFAILKQVFIRKDLNYGEF